ncbi:hypothetical protein B0H19DRAFT_63789 [Mycena capillaripes]|nr:hypothetical protein B0H19DRAFT_63789 [Mycena capillaripes]
MDLKCDNANCPTATVPPSKLFACSGCSTVKYCSKDCQVTSWRSHKQVCRLHPPPSLSGIRLRVMAKEMRSSCQDENAYSAKKIVEVKIEHLQHEAGEPDKVGFIKIQVIDIPMTRRNGGFFECLDENSHLALQFDYAGRLHPNDGCWRASDFQNERFLVYIEELIIEQKWRGKGVGSWVLPKLFHLEVLNNARYLFAWPTVVSFLEPPSINGWRGRPTPAEQAAWVTRRDGFITFYRKVGFRRLANSHFFCFAKKTDHPSHLIPMEEDAPFKELPPPDTEEEERRRDMAYQ